MLIRVRRKRAYREWTDTSLSSLVGSGVGPISRIPEKEGENVLEAGAMIHDCRPVWEIPRAIKELMSDRPREQYQNCLPRSAAVSS